MVRKKKTTGQRTKRTTKAPAGRIDAERVEHDEIKGNVTGDACATPDRSTVIDCESCAYYCEDARVGRNTVNQCRESSPRHSIRGRWPEVSATEWCGKWSPRFLGEDQIRDMTGAVTS